MKITTKTGDRGETSLFGGRRVSKASDFIELVGELDELQAVIGWCMVEAGQAGKVLERVIDDLYRMMSVVGFEMKCPGNIKPVGEEDVEFLEKEMAKYEEAVGDLNKFVRPSGSSELAARLHIVRTVCRRVERRMVEEMQVNRSAVGDIPADAMLKYLNRLSDLLFVMAVSHSASSGQKDG